MQTLYEEIWKECFFTKNDTPLWFMPSDAGAYKSERNNYIYYLLPPFNFGFLALEERRNTFDNDVQQHYRTLLLLTES